MSDCLLFACLFASLRGAGPQLCGRAVRRRALRAAAGRRQHVAAAALVDHLRFRGHRRCSASSAIATLAWLAVTGLLGAGFVGIELYEFAHLIHEGNGPQRSAFLSAFFALVGTHGLHVSVGIVWLVTLMVQVRKHGLIAANRRRLMCLSMFWHFLDVVWIGVFTFVYLMGVLP